MVQISGQKKHLNILKNNGMQRYKDLMCLMPFCTCKAQDH